MDSAILRSCVFGMLLLPLPASASGIFVPADAAVAISQAGERVLFGQQGSSLMAHIQVYYRSQPTDFVWLLPVPGVPTLEPGNGELFSQLTAATQPAYQVDRFYRCADDTQPILGSAVPVPSPELPAGTLSPYESAILPADSQDAVLKWLTDRKYPVPPNLSAALGPYCGRGGSIVALRFQATETAGALEPIVLHYQGDWQADRLSLPLLSGARGTTSKMPLQVWILGPSRAIPLGAANAVLNDAQINWFTGGRNYQEVLAGAIAENGDRAFVTEYAGPSSIAQGALSGAVDVSRYPYLTRLSTVLPPADLTSDPAFGYNSSLPAVTTLAKATMTYHCPAPSPRCVSRGYAGSAGYWGAGYFDCGYYNPAGVYVDVDGYSGVNYGDGYGGMRALWGYGGGYGGGDYGGYSGGSYGGGSYGGGSYGGGGYGGGYGGSAGIIGQLSRSLSTYYPWTVLVTTQGFKVAYTAQAADQGQFFSPGMPYSLRTELLTQAGPSQLVNDHAAAIQTALGMGPHSPPTQPECKSAFGCSAAAASGAREGNHGPTILLSGLLLLLWRARTARARSRCRNAG